MNTLQSTGPSYSRKSPPNLKNPIFKLQEGEFKYSSPHQILHHALFVINNLNTDSSGMPVMLRHWSPEQSGMRPLVKWKDLLSGQWKGPDPLLTSGQKYACIFPQDAESPIWVPDRLIRHVADFQTSDPLDDWTTKKKESSSTSTTPT